MTKGAAARYHLNLLVVLPQIASVRTVNHHHVTEQQRRDLITIRELDNGGSGHDRLLTDTLSFCDPA